MGVELFEAGCHGTEAAHVVGIAQRVKDERIVHPLEEGKVGIERVGSAEDVVGFHVVLIPCHHCLDAVLYLIRGQRTSAVETVDVCLELDLLHGKFLDFPVCLALDGVSRGHVLQVGFHADGLGGVYGKVDDVPFHAQAVKLGILRPASLEGKCPLFAQLHRVDRRDGGDARLLQVERLVVGSRDLSRYGEVRLLFAGRQNGQQTEQWKNAFVFHIFK